MYADWMKNIKLDITLEDIKEWKQRKRFKGKRFWLGTWKKILGQHF